MSFLYFWLCKMKCRSSKSTALQMSSQIFIRDKVHISNQTALTKSAKQAYQGIRGNSKYFNEYSGQQFKTDIGRKRGNNNFHFFSHIHTQTNSPTLTQAVNVRWKVTHYARWQTGIPAGGKSCLRGRHMYAYISLNQPCSTDIFSLKLQPTRVFRRTLKSVK